MEMAQSTPARHLPEAVDAISDLVREHSLETIIVGTSDVNGIFRGKRIPAKVFSLRPDRAISLASLVLTVDYRQEMIPRPPGFQHWWPDWDDGGRDVQIIPDLSTFCRIPWDGATGLVLGEFRRDGAELPYCPRSLLRRVADILHRRGLEASVGPELEFYVLSADDDSRESGIAPRPGPRRPACYDIQRGGRDEELVSAIRRALQELDIEVEASAPEAGVGQHEVNIRYGSPLAAADNAFLLRYAVSELAARHGFRACFMAKPFTDDFGSGFHVHQSLWADGANLFFDVDTGGLSTTAKNYLGGNLELLPEVTCLFAPTLNSYKRLLPHSTAGTTITWGLDNRTVALRALIEGSAGCRIEHRTPGADANPYLAVAAMIACGLYGIDNKIEPPAASTGNVYGAPDGPLLPQDLLTATERFQSCGAIRTLLGEEFTDYFAATRRWELAEFQRRVTDWEIERYLG